MKNLSRLMLGVLLMSCSASTFAVGPKMNDELNDRSHELNSSDTMKFVMGNGLYASAFSFALLTLAKSIVTIEGQTQEIINGLVAVAISSYMTITSQTSEDSPLNQGNPTTNKVGTVLANAAITLLLEKTNKANKSKQ